MGAGEDDERSRRLLTHVALARRLLAGVGEGRWEEWLTAVHRELTAHDPRGLERLLGGFGGMGSFSDLVIHPVNGHTVAEADVGPVNDELARLRSALFDDAAELRVQGRDGR